jgi:hypothetical protein
MPMSPEHRAKMLIDTKEQAAALLDDLPYLRGISAQPDHSPAEIRRVSGTLRRLLVERDITIVAAPRLGRFMFFAPDNKPFYSAGRKIPFTFFASGGMEVFGVKFRSTIVDLQISRPSLGLIDPERTIELRLDGFMSQHVLSLSGRWISRADVIKYVANVGHGVHSGVPQTPTETIISRIRRVARYTKSDKNLAITVEMKALESGADLPFRYSPEAIDPIILELLAAIHFLLISPDTSRLEMAIRDEFGLPPLA